MKKMESINVRFDPFRNTYDVWFCFDDGSCKDGVNFVIVDSDDCRDFHNYVRRIQDDYQCFNVLFY